MAETEFIIEPGRQDIIMRHVFDAPPEMVFKAFTDPELVPRWMGPRKHDTVIDRWDLRHGGQWRFSSRDDQDNLFAFRGVFHHVEAPARIVQTFEFEGMPGHVSLDTAMFEEVDGKTQYTAVSVFQSVEDRDGMVASGMEHGARESLERLDELIETL